MIAHNETRAFAKSVGNTWGLAEVFKVDGGFEIRPLGFEVLSSGLADAYPRPDGYELDPLPAYQPSTEPGYANLSLTVPLARKLGYKALNAVCDLGAFWMPFRARFTK